MLSLLFVLRLALLSFVRREKESSLFSDGNVNEGEVTLGLLYSDSRGMNWGNDLIFDTAIYTESLYFGEIDSLLLV